MVAHAQLYYRLVLRAVSVARDCSVFVVLFIVPYMVTGDGKY